MNKSILIFAGKSVGFELVTFLKNKNYSIDKLVISSNLDLELIHFAKTNNIETIIYDSSTQDQLVQLGIRYEWLINLWSPFIFKKELLSLVAKSLNIHPSLLPQCGGNDNAMWTIRKKLSAGVSLIEIDNEIDSGNIYIQKEISYTFPTTGKELNTILQISAIDLFKETWAKIYKGEITPIIAKGIPSFHKRKQTNQDRIRNCMDTMSLEDFIIWILAHDFSPNTSAEVEFQGKIYKLTIQIQEKLV
jgi:methionyl-tRNA formyltransferase